jgi:hypothetical protein
MAQLEVPVGLREDIKDVVVEYLSRKSFLDRDSYMFLILLAGIGLGEEGEASKEEELKRLREMRKKELERALETVFTSSPVSITHITMDETRKILEESLK